MPISGRSDKPPQLRLCPPLHRHPADRSGVVGAAGIGDMLKQLGAGEVLMPRRRPATAGGLTKVSVA